MIPLVVKFADTPKQKQARLQRQLHAQPPSAIGVDFACRKGSEKACEGSEKISEGNGQIYQGNEPICEGNEPISEGQDANNSQYSIVTDTLLASWDPLMEGQLLVTPPPSIWMDFTFFKNTFESLSFSNSNRKCVTKDIITHSEYYAMNAVTDNVGYGEVIPIIGSMYPHLQLPRGNDSGGYLRLLQDARIRGRCGHHHSIPLLLRLERQRGITSRAHRVHLTAGSKECALQIE